MQQDISGQKMTLHTTNTLTNEQLNLVNFAPQMAKNSTAVLTPKISFLDTHMTAGNFIGVRMLNIKVIIVNQKTSLQTALSP